jgi:DNA mismatch repair protein MutS
VAALAARLNDFSPLYQKLESALAEELPAKIDEGGTIRDGYDAELDQTRDLTRDSQKMAQ